jgi:peptidoglycan/LPS O-acetylase OafA/YrhL
LDVNNATAQPLIAYSATKHPRGHLAASAYLRVFAAASIVWFHVAPSAQSIDVGAIGLALFFFFSFIHSGMQCGVRIPMQRLTRQWLMPWAAWWIFYALVACWRNRGLPPDLPNMQSAWELINWPHFHLWYLPTVFVFSTVLLVVRKLVEPMRSDVKAVLALLAGSSLLLLVAAMGKTTFPGDIAVHATPAAAFGLAYGYCLRFESQRHRLTAFLVIAAVVTVMCVPIWLFADRFIAVAYAVASLSMVLCTLPLPRQRFVMRLSALTLGVYLVHPFVQLVLWKFVGAQVSTVFALETLIVSALVTWGMRRIPYVQKVV